MTVDLKNSTMERLIDKPEGLHAKQGGSDSSVLDTASVGLAESDVVKQDNASSYLTQDCVLALLMATSTVDKDVTIKSLQQKHGFDVLGQHTLQLSSSQVDTLYAYDAKETKQHYKDLYEGWKKSSLSDPVQVLILGKENAVASFQALVNLQNSTKKKDRMMDPQSVYASANQDNVKRDVMLLLGNLASGSNTLGESVSSATPADDTTVIQAPLETMGGNSQGSTTEEKPTPLEMGSDNNTATMVDPSGNKTNEPPTVTTRAVDTTAPSITTATSNQVNTDKNPLTSSANEDILETKASVLNSTIGNSSDDEKAPESDPPQPQISETTVELAPKVSELAAEAVTGFLSLAPESELESTEPIAQVSSHATKSITVLSPSPSQPLPIESEVEPITHAVGCEEPTVPITKSPSLSSATRPDENSDPEGDLNSNTSDLKVDATVTDLEGGATTSDLNVNTTSSDLKVDAITNDTNLTSNTNDPKVDTTTGNLKVDTTASDTNLTSNTSDLKVDAITNDTNLTSNTNDLKIDTTTSDTNLTSNTGDLKVDTITSDTGLTSSTSDLKVETTTSNLKVETTTSNLKVETTTSNLKVETTTSSNLESATPSSDLKDGAISSDLKTNGDSINSKAKVNNSNSGVKSAIATRTATATVKAKTPVKDSQPTRINSARNQQERTRATTTTQPRENPQTIKKKQPNSATLKPTTASKVTPIDTKATKPTVAPQPPLKSKLRATTRPLSTSKQPSSPSTEEEPKKKAPRIPRVALLATTQPKKLVSPIKEAADPLPPKKTKKAISSSAIARLTAPTASSIRRQQGASSVAAGTTPQATKGGVTATFRLEQRKPRSPTSDARKPLLNSDKKKEPTQKLATKKKVAKVSLEAAVDATAIVDDLATTKTEPRSPAESSTTSSRPQTPDQAHRDDTMTQKTTMAAPTTSFQQQKQPVTGSNVKELLSRYSKTEPALV